MMAAELDESAGAEDYKTFSVSSVAEIANLAVSEPQLVTGKSGKIFEHRLGRTPLLVQVQFSKDPQFDDVHIVQWSWGDSKRAKGPVSIRADTGNVYLEFTGGHVFGHWSHTASWTHENEGYFRVIAF